MIKFIHSVYSLLHFQLITLLLLMIVGGMFEGVSLLLLIPILQTAIGSGVDDSQYVAILTDASSFLGLEFSLQFGLTLFIAVFFIQTLLFLFRDKKIAAIIANARKNIRQNLYVSLLESQWSYLISKKRGWLVSAVVNDAEKAGNSIYALLSLMTSIVVSLVYTTTALIIAPIFTIAFAVSAILMFLALKKLTAKGSLFGKTTSEGNSQLQTVLNEHFDAMKLIKGGALYAMSSKLIDSANVVLADVEYNVLLHNAKIKAYAEPVVIILLCTGIFIAIEYMFIDITEIMVVIFIFLRLFPRVIQMNQGYYQVLVYRPSYELVMKITNEARSLQERAFSGGVVFNGLSEKIQFKNVSFSYARNQKTINNIDLVINKGKSLAMVGSSGSGKSTVADLVLGLLEPNKGDIYIDNTSLKDIDLMSYRKRVGYIGQETILINDTIKRNITWGMDISPPDKKIESICKLCHVHEFVCELPDKYDTIIGDKGLMISGGQRQRIAIARALIREPELLILDEATSALDSKSEKVVQQAIENLSNKVTILIIAHRLATIVNSDEIIVLDKGCIVERGSFQRLMSQNGSFKYMYNIQNNS
jgi:ABC-type multidrug transport system fused ATPase/permease subunit